MTRIKGSKLSSKLAFVKHAYGEEMLDQVINTMSTDDRPVISDVLDLRWYPSDLYERLVQTICRVAAHGDEAVYDRMGAETAEHQLTNIYASFRRDDLVKTLKNMVPMHSHMNDPGHMEVDSSRDCECTITVTEPRSAAVESCRISRAFYGRVAELSGATDVHVTERTCTALGDDACRFVIGWAAHN